MRKNLKFPILALGVIAGGLLSSCTVDVENDFTHSGNMLAKAPEVKAYSGDHYWGAPTGTRAMETNWQQYKKVQDYDNKTTWTDWDIQYDPYYPFKDYAPAKTDRGESVSQAEYEYVIEYIRTHQGGDECHLTTYFIQDVGSSHDTYTYTYHDSNNNVDRTVQFTGGNQMDYLVIGDYHFGDYNATGGPRALCINMPINAPEVSPSYKDSWGEDPKTKENAYKFFIITLPDDPKFGENAGKTAYYLGFDYRTKKWDNGNIDYQGDGVYNDWVVKLMPADGSAVLPPTEGPTTCEKCGDAPHEPGLCPNEDCNNEECHPTPTPCPKDDCGHQKHPDYGCGQCYEDGIRNDCSLLFRSWLVATGEYDRNNDPVYDPELDGPEFGPLPETGDSGSGTTNPGYEKGKDEVEVNLALDNKTHDLLESHLSIHVRKATDVEIFIPVPAQFYCAADDMEIVLNHGVGNFIHGGPYSTEFKIGENVVTLTVSFESDGIKITTEGITQDVIDYCWANFEDGITFEVWNYFNDPDTGLPYIDMNDLKEYLDQSTVRFINKLPSQGMPSQYVNSFGRDNGKYGSENPDGKDFHVTPVDDSFQEPYEDYHLNGSSNNDIYKKK